MVPQLYDKMNFDHKPDGQNIHDIFDGAEYQRLKIREQEIKILNKDPDSKTITLTSL